LALFSALPNLGGPEALKAYCPITQTLTKEKHTEADREAFINGIKKNPKPNSVTMAVVACLWSVWSEIQC